MIRTLVTLLITHKKEQIATKATKELSGMKHGEYGFWGIACHTSVLKTKFYSIHNGQLL